MGELIPGTEPWEPSRPWYVQYVPKADAKSFADAFRHYLKEGVEEIMMDFGGAINGLKNGHKVRRDAWNEPGKYVKMEGDKLILVEGTATATYVAPSDDQLAEDWLYVRLPDSGGAVAGDPLAQRTYRGADGPTIAEENIRNDNVLFVDTASAGPVPVSPREDREPLEPTEDQVVQTPAEGEDSAERTDLRSS